MRQTREALERVYHDPRLGGIPFRLRLYAEEGGDAPVVVCEGREEGYRMNSRLSLAAGYVAAEAVRDLFPGGLPALTRPLLWIERRVPAPWAGVEYSLVSFPFYTPRIEGIGFARRLTLGTPSRETLWPSEVAVLTGGEEPF